MLACLQRDMLALLTRRSGTRRLGATAAGSSVQRKKEASLERDLFYLVIS